MKRIITATLLIVSVWVSAVVTGLAAPARADVVAVTLPTAVSISARTVSFSGTVQVSSSTAGRRSASLWFRYPNAPAPIRVGSAVSRRPGFLAVTVKLDASRIKPGVNRLLVKDDADGASRTILFDLRRISRVTLGLTDFRSADRVVLAVEVVHYDPKVGRFIASRKSPVRFQEKVSGVWITVAETVTNASGRAVVLIPAGPGVHRYRAVRPNGVTVLAAISKSVRTS
jgi:hypothetical protein